MFYPREDVILTLWKLDGFLFSSRTLLLAVAGGGALSVSRRRWTAGVVGGRQARERRLRARTREIVFDARLRIRHRSFGQLIRRRTGRRGEENGGESVAKVLVLGVGERDGILQTRSLSRGGLLEGLVSRGRAVDDAESFHQFHTEGGGLGCLGGR